MEEKIAVIGLGNAGLPLAALIADIGLQVIGIDIDENKCASINAGRNPLPQEKELNELLSRLGGEKLKASNAYNDAKDCTTFIIIVPVKLHENRKPDFSILIDALNSIGKILKKRDLVVIETTLPPGTTETLAKRCLEETSGLKLGDFYLANSPERIMTGYAISRLKNFNKVIGGVNKESGNKAFYIYKKFIPNPILVSSARAAEFIKVIEGCYRDVNIGLANTLFIIAEELGIDFKEAQQYANHKFCHILLPSTGVGGHCIPVYPWFLISAMEDKDKYSEAKLLRTVREFNDGMVKYWGEKILLEALKVDKPFKDVKICVKGLTYREDANELYHSRNLELARYLGKKGLNIYVWDSIISKDNIKKMKLNWIEPCEADIIFDCFNLELLNKLSEIK